MIPVLTAAESARLDAESTIPVVDLMRRAGVAAATVAIRRYRLGYGSSVVVVAGPGNNGGDGYVMASALARRGVAVSIVPIGEPRTDPALHHARLAPRGLRTPQRPDLVVDAVFGTGSRPGLPDDIRRHFVGDAPVLSLDLPSGLDTDTGQTGDGTVRADATVAFHSLKPAHLLGDGPDLCGEVEVVDIGLVGGEPAYRVVQAVDAARPDRIRWAHKWSAGSVLVIGGSSGMVGAAVMAARSALRFGAGAVGVATPDVRLAQSLAPEVLAHDITDLPDRYDVWLVGPGLGRSHRDLVSHVVRRTGPTVVDADALGPDALEATHPDVVLTPHAGELRRMGDRPTAATVLRKGNPTIVDGDIPWIVTSGGPELATIGTGDVLSGMVAALLARGLDGPGAARSAAHWHGVAGASLRSRGTVTADRLADEVSRFAWEDV